MGLKSERVGKPAFVSARCSFDPKATVTKGGNRSFAAFAKQGFVSPKAAIDASDYIYR